MNLQDPILQQPKATTYPLIAYLQITLTVGDRVRLGSQLSTWAHLNEMFLLNQFTIEDTKKLLVLELDGACRKQVLTKLRSRLKTKESNHVQQLITSALEASSNVVRKAV